MKTKLAVAVAALAALTLPVQALELVLEAQNKAGGKIQVWSRPCSEIFKYFGAEPGLTITASGKNGGVRQGCVNLVGNSNDLMVYWLDGGRSIYSIADFTDMSKPKARAKTRRANPM